VQVLKDLQVEIEALGTTDGDNHEVGTDHGAGGIGSA
jgi:hypothetical protein